MPAPQRPRPGKEEPRVSIVAVTRKNKSVHVTIRVSVSADEAEPTVYCLLNLLHLLDDGAGGARGVE